MLSQSKSGPLIQFVSKKAFGVPGWISAASGAMASIAFIYAGSSSISTLTASAAARACSSVSAATMAIASPNWKIFSSQSTGRSKPSVLLCFGSITRPLILLVPPAALISFAVITRTTPGMLSASAVSMLRIFA